jgi:hypothetical protein
MRRERRQPTPREWKRITSARPVVRRIPKPQSTRPETPKISACVSGHFEPSSSRAARKALSASGFIWCERGAHLKHPP